MRELTAATAVDQRGVPGRQVEVDAVQPLGLVRLGQPDHDHGDLGGGGDLSGVGEQDVVDRAAEGG